MKSDSYPLAIKYLMFPVTSHLDSVCSHIYHISHDFLMFFLCFSYGFPWFSCDFLMIFLWVFLWFSCGYVMIFLDFPAQTSTFSGDHGIAPGPPTRSFSPPKPHRERWLAPAARMPRPGFFEIASGRSYLVAHPTARKWVITPVIYMG